MVVTYDEWNIDRVTVYRKTMVICILSSGGYVASLLRASGNSHCAASAAAGCSVSRGANIHGNGFTLSFRREAAQSVIPSIFQDEHYIDQTVTQRSLRNSSGVSPASRTIPPIVNALTGLWRGIVRIRAPSDITMCFA